MPAEDDAESQSEGDGYKSIAARIVDAIIENDDIELWHTPEGNGYFSVRYSDGHFEHRALKSKATKQYLGGLYYELTGHVANSSALSDAIIVFNITYLTYHTGIWESTFELKRGLPSYQRSYL
jgi:hypothetical protein